LEELRSRFGVPRKIVTDNAKASKAKALINLCQENGIELSYSTTYYPQGNGLAESSNKNLVRIIKTLLLDHKRAWDSKLKYALWADRITTKRSIGTSPYQLVYGTYVVFPISLGVPVMKLLHEQDTETNDIQRRIYHLMEVHELRETILLKSEKQKAQVKETFDERAKANEFEVEDLVLKWDAKREKKGLHGKLDHLWMGPFKVATPRG